MKQSKNSSSGGSFGQPNGLHVMAGPDLDENPELRAFHARQVAKCQVILLRLVARAILRTLAGDRSCGGPSRDKHRGDGKDPT